MKKIALFLLPIIIFPSILIAKDEPRNWQTGKLMEIKAQQKNTEIWNETRTQGYVNQASLDITSQNNSVNLPSTDYYIAILADDILYVAKYTANWRWSYTPTWTIGDPIEISFNDKGNTMYLKRPDGKELKTSLVRKERIPSKQN